MRIKKYLTLFTIGLHAFFLIMLLFGSKFVPKNTKRISVKVLQEKRIPTLKTSTPIATSSAVKAPPVAKPTPKPVPKKKPVAAKKPLPVEKKTAPKAKKTPKAEVKKPIVSENLARELEESIAKIDQKQDKFKQKKPNASEKKQEPIALASLSSFDHVPLAFSSNGEIKELLVQELQHVLHLPDFGEVKVRLQFRSDGSIEEVKVLQAASKKNRDYLEKELPKQSFPFLADLGLKEKERSFVITFYNDL